MIDRLDSFSSRFRELETLIADPSFAKDQNRYRETRKEQARLSVIMEARDEYLSVIAQLEDARAMFRDEADAEFREMARGEAHGLEARKEALETRIRELIVPRDPLDDKNIIMEIRAGTGGEEAALFVADLFRMYTRFSDARTWKIEVIDASGTELGGYKEVVFSVSGDAVYENLRWESGVHRVQRVPATEGSGRIHTSAVTVAVLPEMEETEIEIRAEDLRVDVMRAGGPGGQCVNTTDSAVRLTHLPTGLVVIQQDEKSQIKNKAKAMRVLRARLFELEESKKQAERAAERRSQVGSGDRSERIRTYNFPQNRVTDHRVGLTLYKLDLVMQGDLHEIVDALKLQAREAALGAGRG
ncbi:MAG: peptide chain release factor 1 [Spirochaetes bacterium]|nr:peptide chain release factor 1 [Spirochaetota bacterium]